MSEDLFGRSIKEQIDAELRENEAPYEFEYINALAYFGLNSYPTEDEVKRVYRRKVAQYHTDTGNTSNEIGKINSNNDIIKKHFKHIKWQQNVRDKKVEIQNLIKNDVYSSNIDSSLDALKRKLEGIYNTYFRRAEYENTIVGLEHLYNQYRNDLREEYKNVLMVYGIVELDPNINTLQEFNDFLIKTLNQGKELFINELDKEFIKYQNDDTYKTLLNIIRKFIEGSKNQVRQTRFLNQKEKEDISTNLRTKINNLKESYNEIEGTLKYLQEFFIEIGNNELSAKSKNLLERLSNLQSEEELNQINNGLEPLEKEAKEYEKRKEQEEIDSYIKQLVSKYNDLIQKASPEELTTLVTKFAKICELISKGKSLNKDINYYQSIETILDEEKQKKVKNETELNPIVYILRSIDERDDEFLDERFTYLYLFYPDINKIECLVDGFFERWNSRFDKGKLVDISQEELQRNFISLDEFLGKSKKLEFKDFMGEPKVYYAYTRYALEFCKDDKGNSSGVSLKLLDELDWDEVKELEKESPEEIKKIIEMIKEYAEGKSKRKKTEEETSKFKINSSGIYLRKNNGTKKLGNFSAPLGKLYSYNVQTSCLEEISFEYIPFDSVYLPVDVLEINFISLEDFILNCDIHMEFIGKSQNFIKVYFSYENNLLAITNIDSTIERLTIEEIYSRVPKGCFYDVSFKGKTEIKLSQEEKREIIEEIQNYIEKNKRTSKFGRGSGRF